MEIIRGTNIQKTYGKGRVATAVLKGVDITINQGEFVAIMGKSGAGKSTLLYQLSALDRPTGGEIAIDGKNILELSEVALMEFRLYTLGYVFQDYALIPDLTAGENIALPLLMRGTDWHLANETAKKALIEVDLPDKFESLPSQLSGGEQQRVSIARAIAGKPKIIFADEPTANLDSVSGRAIIDLLATLQKSGETIVMVTHEEEYTNHCNRVIYLEDGIIVPEKGMVRPRPAELPKPKSESSLQDYFRLPNFSRYFTHNDTEKN